MDITEELNIKFKPDASFVAGYIRAFDLAPVTQLRIGDYVAVFKAEFARDLGRSLIEQSEDAIHMANGLKEMEQMNPKLTGNQALIEELRKALKSDDTGAFVTNDGVINLILNKIDEVYGAK